ncbi:MAG: SprT family zinc-dependent metalloprotease [Gammaproteobacteria bacterium]|nr:SprT family zinc-dependent metalloprotease [Gammaproteobacteria bacterium]
MPLPEQLTQQVLERVEQCYLQAETQLNCVLARPIILFNQRGKIAGTALLQRNTLRFHPQILRQNISHYLEHVIAHEAAHLIVWQRYGRVQPHGKHWQYVMTQVFNLPAARTHSYNTDNIGIKEISYQCQCSVIKFSVRRHNMVLKGTRYLCRSCRSELQPVP